MEGLIDGSITLNTYDHAIQPRVLERMLEQHRDNVDLSQGSNDGSWKVCGDLSLRLIGHQPYPRKDKS